MTEENHNNTENFKRNRRSKPKRKLVIKDKARLIKTLITGALIIAILGVVSIGATSIYIVKTAPPIDPSNIYSLLSENSFLYDDEGNLIDNLQNSAGLRTNIEYKDLPPNLVNAFVSIEDKTFWTHNGFNFVRIFGAVFESITGGGSIRGTSTITQQLARNLYLAETKDERSMTRKLKEAYYSILLEKHLQKEQIIEAYLNTIHLGFNTYGVQAAAQAYFSKDVKDLTLAECAALATLPKSPSKYAFVKRIYNEDIEASDEPNIISKDTTFTLIYNESFKDRQNWVLKFMVENGYISDEDREAAYAVELRDSINPSGITDTARSDYFTDYVKKEAIVAIMNELKLNEDDARSMLYNGGLKIYSTMNMGIQEIVENEFAEPSNFPSIKNVRKDSSGNILNASGNVILYNFETYFDDNNNFVLMSDDFSFDSKDNLILKKGHQLNFNKNQSDGKLKDINLSFKDLYTNENSILHCIQGGNLLITSEYKSFDDDGNVIISADFLEKNPDFFKTSGDRLLISSKHYSLASSVIQPQSAMVIMDPNNGQIKALVGGRNIEGTMLYSRALNPRQPGSSIKPLSVYTPALLNGWTAATTIEDAPMYVNGELWPTNSYSGFKGIVTLREAVQNSINVAAVKVVSDIGVATSADFLKKLGITTLVEKGDVNDMNAAALGLGGMSKGISPLEMASAYSTLANGGVYNSPSSITKILSRTGETIYETEIESKEIFDSANAFIITDVLRNAVSNGTGSRARIYSDNATIPVAGKTGTTSKNYDAWFCGYTPYYTATLWIGNDVNIQLPSGSSASAQLWGKIMKQVHKGLAAKSFTKPDSVISATIDTKSGKLPSELSALDPRGTVISEYFAPDTVPTETDDIHVKALICSSSNLLATPACPSSETSVQVRIDPTNRPSLSTLDAAYNVPAYYCNIHNNDTSKYPIPPGTSLAPQNVVEEKGPGNNGGGNGNTTPPGDNTDNPGKPPKGDDDDFPDGF